MRVTVLLFILISSMQAMGQQHKKEVRGIVQDSTGANLEGVNVLLISKTDNILVSTNSEGRFLFEEVIASEFRISFSLLGYQIHEENFSLNPILPKTETIHVILKNRATILNDVNVYGILPMLIKPDTIQYNALAYLIRSSDLVEDLMKKLNGIDISRSGLVRAQGQVVSRVKVNGKEFFTGDVLTATRNIPASMVDNIQIIEDYGEAASFSGIKKNEPERIININLKKGQNRMAFGQVTGGIGTDYRYIGSVSANSFNDSQQISVLGSTNNTNASLFSFGDVNGGSGREKIGTDLNNMMELNDGINRTNSVGINYRDEISQKTSTYGGYVLTDRKTELTNSSLIKSEYQNNTISRNEESNSILNDNIHKLNWNVESKLDPTMYLKVSPMVSYSVSDRIAYGTGITNNKRLTTHQSLNSEERQRSPNFNLEAFFNKVFPKHGRSFNINMVTNFNSNFRKDNIKDYRVDSSLISAPFERIEKLNQRISNDRANDDFQLQAAYIEPISKYSFLELSYEFNFSHNKNQRDDRQVAEVDDHTAKVDSLFLKYAYRFTSNKIGFLYQYIKQKYTYQIGFGFQPLRISGYTFNKEILTSKESINFVPNARFTYNINQQSSLSIVYRGQNSQPDFYQIQPVRDNSNTQNILVGNPDLQSEFINNFGLQYRKFSIISGNTFFADLSFKGIKNKIVTDRVLIPNSTRQETGFTNTSGYFDTHAYYLWSLDLVEKVFTLGVSSSADYNNNISFLNHEKNKGRILNFMQVLQLNYMKEDWLSLDLKSSFSLSRIRNSLPMMYNTDANTLALGLGGKFYAKDWVFSLDAASRFNNGYSNSINTTLINFYLERFFGKNDRAAIRLQAFDLLNQNTGINYEAIGNDVFESRSNRLGRYFLLSFNLKLQKFPT